MVRFRPEIAALPPYVPGKTPSLGPDGCQWKLSSNENAYPPLPSVAEALSKVDVNRYPDTSNAQIAAATAAHIGVLPDQLVFGAGSMGVLAQLISAVSGPGNEVVYAWRSFEAYPLAVQTTGARSRQVALGADLTHDLAALAEAVGPQTSAVVLCTPNNPTGTVIPHEAACWFVEQVPSEVLVIVDEAYLEFVDDPAATRGLELAQRYPNVVSLRTFSKAYGLAGLRIGYAVGDADLVRVVRSATFPFTVSITAQAGLLASLAADDELRARVDHLRAERDRVLAEATTLGLGIAPSHGNFFWIPAGANTAQWAELFDRRGLAVRAFSSGGSTDGIRVSIGEDDANDVVCDVLRSLRS